MVVPHGCGISELFHPKALLLVLVHGHSLYQLSYVWLHPGAELKLRIACGSFIWKKKSQGRGMADEKGKLRKKNSWSKVSYWSDSCYEHLGLRPLGILHGTGHPTIFFIAKYGRVGHLTWLHHSLVYTQPACRTLDLNKGQHDWENLTGREALEDTRCYWAEISPGYTAGLWLYQERPLWWHKQRGKQKENETEKKRVSGIGEKYF